MKGGSVSKPPLTVQTDLKPCIARKELSQSHRVVADRGMRDKRQMTTHVILIPDRKQISTAKHSAGDPY